MQSPRIIEDIIASGFRVDRSAQADARVTVISKPIYGALIKLLASMKARLAQTARSELDNLVSIFDADLRNNFMDLNRLDEARAKLTTYSKEVFGEIHNREALTKLLSEHYDEAARSRPCVAFACNLIGYFGAILFLLPSVEILLRALAHLVGKLFT